MYFIDSGTNINPLKTKKVKVTLCPVLPDFRKSIVFWKVPRLRPFVFVVKQGVDEDKYGAMVE
jgi:hypothetical protein